MKKGLFLLPLLAGLALVGCNGGNGGGTGGGGGGGTGGGGGGEGGNDPVALSTTLDFETVFEAAGGKKTGYAAIAAIDEIGGASVQFTDVCVMRYYSDGTPEGSSIPAWDPSEDDPAEAIQFKAGSGEIEFYNVTCSKVTVVLLTSYKYAKGDNISVEFDGSKVTEKCEDQTGEATGWKQYGTKKVGDDTETDFTKTYDINRFELTFSISGGAGDLRIYNSGAKGMRSVESITIE